MERPLITVLMPVYNSAAFLSEAIESILNQTFKSFEFLIIDDCSTDTSLSIIKSFSDKRIRVIQNNRNLGISTSLNLGIAMARGEVIARMDADDISSPDRLSVQYDFIMNHPDVGMVACWARVINEAKELIRTDEFKPEYYYYNTTFICWIYHPTVLYRKDVIRSLGGYTVLYSEDFELFWKLFRTTKVHVIPRFLLDYRITRKSLHMVLKRDEYELAQHAQVVRNIKFYMGGDFAITPFEVECLRHNFGPHGQVNSVLSILVLFWKLKAITDRILITSNVNCVKTDIQEAYYHKKVYMAAQLSGNWSKSKQSFLLVLLFPRKVILSKIKRFILTNLEKKTAS